MGNLRAVRNGSPNVYVTTYSYDERQAKRDSRRDKDPIRILRLRSNADWARFVMEWRTETYSGPDFDIAYAPSADGEIDDVVELYRQMIAKGYVDYDVILKELRPHLLGRQIIFKNEQVIKTYLNSKKADKYLVKLNGGYRSLRVALSERFRRGPRNI